ncbi:phospholipid-binding protein MlaC [Campylobacter sp. US33a]|uniref:MlaC/ttg2D family ABC transporter substrate-binding protein n=1 Tax=Campylobacter sp. US33a TaxID=2498120 RepID=UPI001068D1F3|nr:ABC transporter substrate-binding protein [Campylobacter sp. US33a]TEY04042.1 toluene tolerance protein [Campylobacter sp. US33a]
MKIFALLLILNLTCFALKLENISTTMQTNIDKSLQILSQSKGDKTLAAKDIFALFDEIFDYKLMARLSLGKFYEKLDKNEQEKYEKAFEASLKNSFTSKLTLYKDQILKVKKGEQKNEKRYFLSTSMMIDGEEKFVIFKFYNNQNDWLIYDVDVLGVSIVQTYRSQFEDHLKNEKLETLITKLENIKI